MIAKQVFDFEPFVIDIDVIPSTGYTAYLPDTDESIMLLRQQYLEPVPPVDGEGNRRYGGGGIMRFTMMATAAGSHCVTVVIKRVWERGKAPLHTYITALEVAPNPDRMAIYKAGVERGQALMRDRLQPVLDKLLEESTDMADGIASLVDLAGRKAD